MATRNKVVINNKSMLEFVAHRAITRASHGAANALRHKLADTSGGGRKYPTLPNPSSAPDEYPVKQSGYLLDSIGLRVVSTGYCQVGILNATEDMFKLEFEPPSMGGRAPISRAFNDPDVREEMLKAMSAGLT